MLLLDRRRVRHIGRPRHLLALLGESLGAGKALLIDVGFDIRHQPVNLIDKKDLLRADVAENAG